MAKRPTPEQQPSGGGTIAAEGGKSTNGGSAAAEGGKSTNGGSAASLVKRRFLVLSSIKVEGVRHHAGARLDLDDEQADQLAGSLREIK